MDSFTVNQDRDIFARQVNNVLKNCNILFECELEDQENKIVLHVRTDIASIEYEETARSGMDEFLKILKEHSSNKNDIEKLQSELVEVAQWKN